jgi:hypothetical protein
VNGVFAWLAWCTFITWIGKCICATPRKFRKIVLEIACPFGVAAKISERAGFSIRRAGANGSGFDVGVARCGFENPATTWKSRFASKGKTKSARNSSKP